jgi:hypothetical protein
MKKEIIINRNGIAMPLKQMENVGAGLKRL